MARRRRSLTAEEQALWDRVRAAATPLDPGSSGMPPAFTPVESPGVGGLALPAPPPVAPALPRPALPSRVPGRPAAPVQGPAAPAPLPAPRMDRSRFDRLRRGRLAPEARLDLHGMTTERAHGALIGFILRAHADGLRLVLVITGKGRDGEAFALAPHARGILRHSVPHWLAAPPLVAHILDVLPAHRRHGGGGALYVYLRRRREG